MAALRYTHEVGLHTIAVIRDQETSQTRLWRELEVTPQNPGIRHPVTGGIVFIMPDPVHLLNGIRNNLINHPIQVNNVTLCISTVLHAFV